MRAMRYLALVFFAVRLSSPAAEWVVDDKTYTNGSVETHTLAWAVGKANGTPGEDHTITIASTNAMVENAVFASRVQVNSAANTNVQMQIQFTRGGGASGIRLNGATFDAGAPAGSVINNCRVTADINANSNEVSISNCHIEDWVDVLNLGSGISFTGNEVNNGRVSLLSGTVSGNTFLNGRLSAIQADISGNTFNSQSESVGIVVYRGNVGDNTYTGALHPAFIIGTNLYLADIERMALTIRGDDNYIFHCGIVSNLSIRGQSNDLAYCDISDGKIGSNSIAVSGDWNLFRSNTFHKVGGIRIEGNGTVFRGNTIYSNRYGVAVLGNGNHILLNTIGLTPSGQALSFEGDGLAVYGDDNTIGGAGPSMADGNRLLAGSGAGIRVIGSLNVLRGNYVGAISNGASSWIARGFAGAGIWVCNGISNTIDGNVVLDSGSHGIVATNGPYTQVKDCRLGLAASNVFAGNAGHGLLMEGCPHGDLWGNWIAGSGQSGMELFDIPDSEIVGNRLGYIPEISAGRSNALHGIHLINSSNVAIGLKSDTLENVVAGQGGHGIFVEHDGWRSPDSDCGGLTVRHNWVGHYEGRSWPNAGDGIALEGVNEAWIGGTNLFEGNYAGANGGAGLGLDRCSRLTIYNNDLGVWFTPGGATNVPNLDGIRADNIRQCAIGGGRGGQPNYIAANRRDGIRFEHETGASASNTIQGNFIGVDSTGLTAIPNGGDGLRVEGNDNLIGGTMGPLGGVRAGNIVSGNASNGLVIGGWSNVVAGNFIGVDDTGRASLPNGWNGLVAQCTYTRIGDPILGGNIIGGNGGCGILLDGAGMSNTVQNNFIGVGLGGTDRVPNGLSGIYLGEWTGKALIGGPATNEANYIGNNGFYGVHLEGADGGNRVQGNWIGLSPTNMSFGANEEGGVLIEEASSANDILGNWIDGYVGVKIVHARGQWIENNFIGFDPSSPFDSTQMIVGIDLVNAGANRIGGDRGNDIGATRQAGISIQFTDTNEWAVSGFGNHVFSNRIGVATNRLGVVTNGGDGIRLSYCGGNWIGDADHPNWIANGRHGVYSLGSFSNDICGNRIGQAPDGAVYGNRGHGIYVSQGLAEEIGITSGSSMNDAGNVIVGSAGHGVQVFYSERIGIAGNDIGHDPQTRAPWPNLDGVHLGGSSNCLVGLHIVSGVINVYDGNAIAGNAGHGVYVGSGGSNQIGGNCIGVSSNGRTMIANGGDGIHIVGSANNEIGSVYGECYEEGRNVISGNASNGIALWADDGTRSAHVAGNFIGTDAAGAMKLPNGGYGLYIENSGGNNIGSSDAWCRNTIVNNGRDGVAIVGELSAGNQVVGNYIGVTAAGAAMGNAGHGLYVSNAPAIVVGGMTAVSGNAIGDNDACGIRIEGPHASGAAILANIIGAAPNGIAARSNGQDGLFATWATNLMVGGSGAQGNVVVFNGRNGIQLVECEGALLEGNRVGVDNSVATCQGNRNCGILISNSSLCVIGPNNAIGGNGAEGLRLSGPSCDRALIVSNLVGISAGDAVDLANGADGIHLRGGDRNKIIGGNVVAKNFGHGVAIYTGARNTILGNRIFGNALEAIHVATNEPGMQPNEGIRPPAITNALSGSTWFQGSFAGKTNERYILEVYYAWFTNSNGAQAQFFLAQTNLFSGPAGLASLDILLPATAPMGSWLTMNASDTNGNSSELCLPVRVLNNAYLAWQNAHTVTNGPDGDMDGDFSGNLGEYVADTDPHDGQSLLRMSWASGSEADVLCSSTARLYTVEVSSNLWHGLWAPLSGYADVTGTGGSLPVDIKSLMSNQVFNVLRTRVRLP